MAGIKFDHVYKRFGDVTVLNDAYNANPASMKAALETAGHLPVGSGGRRLAIVGDMLELGGSSERFHREVGEFAATQGFDHLVCVGPQAKWVKEAAIARGMDLAKVTHFEDSTAAAAVVPGWLRGGRSGLWRCRCLPVGAPVGEAQQEHEEHDRYGNEQHLVPAALVGEHSDASDHGPTFAPRAVPVPGTTSCIDGFVLLARFAASATVPTIVW